MKTSAFFSIMFVLFVFNPFTGLNAQSTAQEIETLLGTSAVTYSQAARFALEASDAFITRDAQEAYRFAAERNWLPKNASADQAARLDGISLLLMRSFGLKGGIFYTLTKNAHFAYREMVYRNYIIGRADPMMNVSGELFLFMIGRIIADRDREEAALEEERRLREERDAARNAAQEAERQRIAEREAAARRETLAAEISAILDEAQVHETTTVEATSEGVMITLSNIQFLPDSIVLPDSEKPKLQNIANILRNIPNLRLLITGHTAYAGTVESMYEISEGRAHAVADYLVSLGAVRAENIITIGYGGDRPIGDNSTPEGMAANRRVEITILED